MLGLFLLSMFTLGSKEPSLIVMDNAPYHSVVVERHPTSAWKKQQIEEWLTEHNIQFIKGIFKAELLFLARYHTPPKR
ncbi:unnamed protein product [Brassicogethes aeneus]|uniref:Uncharacterized protein n=1 Tax=Brassicogethes aeneus TaxID=1431903 RepID=A0A9P0B7Z0_BRAAE|nr:unnamed protein product [Brassicogethes aeneus]